ncbi:unnamed protein product [Candidula unifasciata]|uniref:Transmembrane protein 70 n=1 Tax=Candidula unifasciata TaxID=100452 RepID=A0A8S3YG71_9EUPU|nr:unnamed protein product [Candidula unifasciata]
MSVSFKLISRGLIGPLFSRRLSGLAGVCSSVDITGVMGTARTTSQPNLHLSCLPQKLLNATERPNNHTIIRLYSSTSEDSSLGHLVYKGRVAKGLRALKIFSLSTSAIGLLAQPYLLITYQNMPLVAALPIFATLNCFVFVNPLLIHFIAKKYVTELYFNPDTKVFTAYLLTFFARRQVITFTAADVAVPDVPNMFAMLTVRGRPLFVHEDDFTSIEVYKHLMGFDRPLKFLGEDAVNPSYQHQDKTNT